MFNIHEKAVSPLTRKEKTLLKDAAGDWKKLAHYESTSKFAAALTQFGPLASDINFVLRRIEIPELKDYKIQLAKVHRSFMDSMRTLYSLDSSWPVEQQDEYLFKYLKGQFLDISLLEPEIQLVPVSVDADIVREVLQQHPGAAFKIKVKG